MRKNYRPITSLTAVDKLFEQLLIHRLMCHYGKTLNSKMRVHRRKVFGLTDVGNWQLVRDNLWMFYLLIRVRHLTAWVFTFS